ncbi:MAG TPA: hypothetical protein VFS92_04295, partial [Planctomycetota bacterium]|nr:hypothetical protein [Planctomycetota bacterium]
MRDRPAPRPSTPAAPRAAVLALLVLAACAKEEPGSAPLPQPAHPTVIAGPSRVPEIEEEIAPDVIETRPIDEAERVIESLGDPRFNSDAPFEGQGINSSIGIGGGA